MVASIQRTRRVDVFRLARKIDTRVVQRDRRTAARRFSRISSRLCRSRSKVQPGREKWEVGLHLARTRPRVGSRIAWSRSSNRNSLRCCPMRSMTVRWLLRRARRRPRPSCCVKTVAEAVGRSSRMQSTSGTSTPSPSTSTEKTQQISPAWRAASPSLRSSAESSPVRERLGKPASRTSGHVPGVFRETQKPKRPHSRRVKHDPLNRVEQLRDSKVVSVSKLLNSSGA